MRKQIVVGLLSTMVLSCGVVTGQNAKRTTGFYALFAKHNLTQTAKAEKSEAPTCPVTIGRLAPKEAESMFGGAQAAWKDALYVGGLWKDGIITFQPGEELSMKFGWFRGAGMSGKLKIYGKRLDGEAPPLTATIPDGYGETGFQSSGVYFPTEGCWEITGELGKTKLTFVTKVIRVSDHKQK